MLKMKMFLLVISVIAALTLTHSKELSDIELEQWQYFKIKYEKEYESGQEEEMRMDIFLKNLQFVEEHNAKYRRGEVTFNVKINKLSDMTSEEFISTKYGYKPSKTLHQYSSIEKPFATRERGNLPSHVDWRDKGAVTPVKDQGKCGSCWAFSATGCLESQTFILKNKLIPLSEQNLIDCSVPQGNHGCNGGEPMHAFEYIASNGGIDTDQSYSYEGKNDSCRYNSSNRGSTDTGYIKLKKGSEAKLKDAVAYVGPISTVIDAHHGSFHHYHSGVYTEPSCSTTKLTHAVLVVGYGTNNTGGPYWMVKNSWGTDWGMDGYIMMARNNHNMCGIATDATYPILTD